MKKFFDLENPMFRPLWVRILVVALCTGWAVVELRNGNAIWAVIFGAAGAYLGWQFFLGFDPEPPKDE